VISEVALERSARTFGCRWSPTSSTMGVGPSFSGESGSESRVTAAVSTPQQASSPLSRSWVGQLALACASDARG
jgi:hypothetical protein